MAAPRGRVSLFGGLPRDEPTVTLDAHVVHYRELSVVGASGSSPADNAAGLALIADGSVPLVDHAPAAAEGTNSIPTGCRRLMGDRTRRVPGVAAHAQPKHGRRMARRERHGVKAGGLRCFDG